MREEHLLDQLDRIIRLLRRRPAGKQHLARGAHRLLKAVEAHDGITTRELADTLELRPSSLNERLLRLEKEEILIRERDPSDQRMYAVRILPKGERYLEEMNEERKKRSAALRTLLTEEEMRQMVKLTNKLADGLAAQEEQTCR